MISSVDGRLVSFRCTFLPNGDSERTISNHYERIAAGVGEDGFIIGRKTIEGNSRITGQRIEASGVCFSEATVEVEVEMAGVCHFPLARSVNDLFVSAWANDGLQR